MVENPGSKDSSWVEQQGDEVLQVEVEMDLWDVSALRQVVLIHAPESRILSRNSFWMGSSSWARLRRTAESPMLRRRVRLTAQRSAEDSLDKRWSAI
ncbi:hypothetical protein EYF80_049454 [Liparis tanakae]|uniref:Uncharacterized protein n=1 Tax=Liparis tanakae TaxID=230148 RepID=A0A4Z2FHI2_9TELE|nr:hypothetical protein EYF80_049454 [Liparis tanakae]